MDKYRIKLKNERIVGPFLKAQVQELYDKEIIDGTEMCQAFPAGDWLPISSFTELKNEADNNDATFIKNIQDLNLDQPSLTKESIEEVLPDASDEEEIKLELGAEKASENQGNESIELNLDNGPSEANIEMMDEVKAKEESEQSESFPTEFQFEKKDQTKVEIEVSNEQPLDLDKTIVKSNIKTDKQNDVEKTMVNPEAAKYFEEQKRIEEKKKRKEKEKKIEEEVQNIDYESESTQMINMQEMGNTPVDEAKEAELELRQIEEAKKQEEIERQRKEEQELKGQIGTLQKSRDLKLSKEKRKKIIMYVAAFMAIWLLFDEEDSNNKKGFSPITPVIEYPVQYEVPDSQKAQQNKAIGDQAYKADNFLAKVKSMNAYKESLANSLNNNPAIGKYVMVASELLPHLKRNSNEANKLYKLIQLVKSKSPTDIDVATGISSFYYNIGKYEASITTIDEYLNLSSPSIKLFAIYLGALRESGKLGKAGKVYEKLKAQPSKSHEVYIETIKFDLLNENYTEANLTIAEAIQVFPKSVELFLLKAKIDIYKEDYEGLQQTLKAINAMNSQSSIYYYSRYLEYFGLLSVSQGKNELATQLFKKALKNFESPELRSKLAQLQSSNATGEISDLILKSKSIDLMNKAKSALREEDLNAALNYAISAVDTSKNYSPAQVLLAKIQIEKGFYEIAISSLEELTKRDSLDPVSNFALIRAYVKSFKFSKAKTHLSLLANTKLKDNSEYPAVVSELFLAVGDFLQAVTWLTKTIQLNPLNEKYYYKLAKVFLDNKKFDKAKSMITRAIDLSPNNPSFRVLYSNIIYEMDNVETAIGYLRGLENDFIDDPEINGQIAIYYFKSGQLNLFQEQKNKMESSPKKTTKLYKFLIDSSIIDEKFDDVIKYGEELLSLNPGDLETRMLLGKIYFEKGTEEGYKESLKQFNSVKQRLPTYPKLLYYIGRINLMIGRVDEAIALANKEMKANPELEETYILLGEIYLEQKKFVEAERYYKEAQKRNSRSVDALLGLAYISSKKNQYEIALDLYKKAQTMAQQKVEIHKYLGDTYRNLGQGKLAIESYKVYLELVPESKYRKEIENYIRLLK